MAKNHEDRWGSNPYMQLARHRVQRRRAIVWEKSQMADCDIEESRADLKGAIASEIKAEAANVKIDIAIRGEGD